MKVPLENIKPMGCPQGKMPRQLADIGIADKLRSIQTLLSHY